MVWIQNPNCLYVEHFMRKAIAFVYTSMRFPAVLIWFLRGGML